jgi:hypothetical protein
VPLLAPRQPEGARSLRVLTWRPKRISRLSEKEPVMFDREHACYVILSADVMSGEGSLFSPVFKTRATKTTTKTV